jgi:hypothetical protein
MPSAVGKTGATEVFWPDMSEDEKRALERSAETLRNAVAKYVKRYLWGVLANWRSILGQSKTSNSSGR